MFSSRTYNFGRGANKRNKRERETAAWALLGSMMGATSKSGMDNYSRVPIAEDGGARDEGSSGGAAAAARPMSPQQQVLAALAACFAWLIASSTIILTNRYIMVELDFHYPMAVAVMGMSVTAVFSYIVCDVLVLVPPVQPPVEFTFYLTHVFPVGAIQGLAMWLSNQMYLLLTVAFIEMTRALYPVFTMLALYLTGLESVTPETVKAVVLTAFGCAIAAYGEIGVSVAGLLCCFGNLTLEAARLVLTQFLLCGCNWHPLQGLKYAAPAAVLCLGVMSAFMEVPDMVASQAHLIVLKHWYWFLIAATMGLAVNLLGNVIIKYSSATTLKVLMPYNHMYYVTPITVIIINS